MQSRFCCFYTFLYNWRLISSLVLTLYDQREQTWFNQTLLLSIQFHAMKTWIKMNHNLISLGWNFDIGVLLFAPHTSKTLSAFCQINVGARCWCIRKWKESVASGEKWQLITFWRKSTNLILLTSESPLIDMIFCQDPSMSFKGFENTTFVNTWIYIRLKSLKIFWFGI